MNNYNKKIEEKLGCCKSEDSASNYKNNGTIAYTRETLCYSLGGVPVYIIKIASSKKNIGSKKYIVITARVHSSETPGLYKVQGILKFLLSNDPIVKSLREEFVFLIVPMMNPDGVILGNNRCSLAGYDLNRCWGDPSSIYQPIIFAIKERLQSLKIGRAHV